MPDLSVRENLLLAHLGAHRGFGLGYGKREKKIDELMARLELPPDRLSEPNLLNFSGGMQQKIIIARWLLLEPKVLILDEPTKGVDIGTRASIYAILRDIAATGAAILIVSSEFEELLGLADRVIVVSDGTSIADVPSAYLDEEKLTLLAAPRASMERYRRLLQELANQCDGAAFWAILDDDRVFCLNTATANANADPDLRAGSAPRFDETPISAALRARSSDFVLDPTSGLQSLLVDVHSHRGHELGSIGVVIRPDAPPRRRRRCAPPFKTVSARHYDRLSDPGSSKPIGADRAELHVRAASARGFNLRSAPLELRMLALAIIIAVALSLLSPYFLKTNNLLNLLDQSVVTGIVAIGMTFVILTGGIDLSVGSVVGLTGVILGLSLHHFSIPVAIALADAFRRGNRAFLGAVDRVF